MLVGRSVSMLVSRSALSWCLTSSRSAMLVVSCSSILLIFVVSYSSIVVLFYCSTVLQLLLPIVSCTSITSFSTLFLS
uniref:Putative ovule protein n=1 Tax=Solanum chacoense TaxID=4108 RepID=A0A0V0HCA7_SOLCH